MKCLAILALAAVAQASGLGQLSTQQRMAANPIRKVVTLLQNVQKKVKAEAKAEEELYNKFMCYCKSGAGQLQASIAGSDAKIPEVESAIAEAESQKKQLDADLVAHRGDREAAKAAMAKAAAIREKEAKDFASYKADAEANIGAIKKAVSSLESGMAGGFLQTGAANLLKNLFVSRAEVSDIDRQDVLAFLSGSASYAPSGGEITGILKQMGDEMAKDLADATAQEEGSIKVFNELMAAKKKEVDTLTSAIEEKTIRSGEVAVKIVEMKNDLSSTEKALLDDKKFLADLDKNCAQKEAEWSDIVKARNDEQVALSETINLLNSDDALELFKKTLPSASASFVQVATRESELRSRALAVLRAEQNKAPPARHHFDFIMLALRGKKGGFDKVIKMVDDMVALLKKEQTDDDNKKEYCDISFDSTDDKKKGLEQTIADAEKAAADAEEGIATLTSEIKALKEGIEDLDKSVVEATEQRKEENEEYTELMASNTAAVDLIGLAKNRLNKFYNPKLYKAPPKRELSEEDRIAVNMGGTAPPTPAPGGIGGTGITAFVQVSAHDQFEDAPADAPEAPKAFAKKSEETNGVIAMMDLLIKDLEKEMQVAETEEKDAQSDYEQMSKDAAAKRAADAEAIVEKDAAKADTEAALQTHKDTKTSSTKELMATLEYIQSLHGECDWLLSNFDVRKEARAGEVDALGKAKAVLNGADYSLLQTRSLRGRA